MLTLGIAASLATACSWACSSVIHADVARRIGSHSLLLLRQPLAVVFLGVCALVGGEFREYPLYWLGCAAISGFLAIFLHDWALYESIQRVGVRSALVCNSLSAVCTAMLGVIFLKEELGLQGVAGVLVATAGVILVVMSEHRTRVTPLTVGSSGPRAYAVGVVMALGTAILSAVGMIFTKEALTNGIPPLFTAMTRNVVALVGYWIVAILVQNIAQTMVKAKETKHLWYYLAAGCLLGPGGGTWMFMVGMQNAPAAVVATLVGLQPVALTLISGLWERRCPSPGSIIGAVTACSGATLLLWR